MLGPLLQADRKQLVFWILCTILLLLKIFQGDQSFFIQKWGVNFEEGPLLDWYKWTYHNFATFMLYAIVPFVFVKIYFKDKLSELGLCIGDWKFGLKATVVSFVVGAAAAYISSNNPEHRAFYPLTSLANESPKLFFFWGVCYLPHYIGLEFFMRGFMGFKLKEKHGVLVAVMVPMLVATLLHIGKPQGEAWGAAIAAIYFGLLTFRTKSILWPTIFHFYMGMVNTYFCGI